MSAIAKIPESPRGRMKTVVYCGEGRGAAVKEYAGATWSVNNNGGLTIREGAASIIAEFAQGVWTYVEKLPV